MTKILAAGALAAILALLGGCAATVVKASPEAAPIAVTAESARLIALFVTGAPKATGAGDWIGFRNQWTEAMKAEAQAAGRQFTFVEGDTRPGGEPGTLVTVYVNDYRWVSAGARFAVGVFTGNAFVDAKVTFTDLPTGEPLGERAYNTTSSAGQGIFAPMTERQVAAICKEIVAEITPR